MGVAGCGKSVVGESLAQALDATFIEGDQLHPAANVAKMASGRALDDDDRKDWLAAIGNAITKAAAEGKPAVAACSALRRRYRDALRRRNPQLWFLHLVIDPDTARQRVGKRANHFMPSSLIPSQFQTLEPLAPDERGFAADGTEPVEALVRKAIAAAAQTGPRGGQDAG